MIKVVPNATYYIKCSYTHGLRILAYDKSGDFISDMGYKNNATLTTPNNCGYRVEVQGALLNVSFWLTKPHKLYNES